jgi:hypothetical protein
MSEQDEALERLRLKKDAYTKLFGTPDNLTPYGKVVLADLDAFCARNRETIHMDSNGRLDPYTTVYRDGKRAVADRIYLMITWSEQ